MTRHFTGNTKISTHNKSYSVHPDKSLIESMGWKKGDELTVIPIPEKGIICLKGRKTNKTMFEKRFYERFVLKNKKRFYKILKKFYSLKSKLGPLDYVSHKRDFLSFFNLINELEKYLSKGNKNIAKINQNRSKALSRYKNKGPIFLGQKIKKFDKQKYDEIKKASS